MSVDHIGSLFNAHAQLDEVALAAALDDASVTKMTDAECAALIAVVDTHRATEAAEQRVIDARKQMASLSVAHDDALAKLTALRGAPDPVALIKQALAIHNGSAQRDATIPELEAAHSALQAKGRALDAKAKKSGTDDDAEALRAFIDDQLTPAHEKLEHAKTVEAATVAYNAAEVALAEARAEYHNASTALNPVRHAHGSAIVEWSKHSRKLEQIDLARAAAAKTNEARLAAFNAAPPSTDPRDLPISRAYAARKDVSRITRNPRGADSTRRPVASR